MGHVNRLVPAQTRKSLEKTLGHRPGQIAGAAFGKGGHHPLAVGIKHDEIAAHTDFQSCRDQTGPKCAPGRLKLTPRHAQVRCPRPAPRLQSATMDNGSPTPRLQHRLRRARSAALTLPLCDPPRTTFGAPRTTDLCVVAAASAAASVSGNSETHGPKTPCKSICSRIRIVVTAQQSFARLQPPCQTLQRCRHL